MKNCADDPKELAEIIADRTGSQVVQVIGKKIVLYKLNPEKEKKRKQKEKLAKAPAKPPVKTGKKPVSKGRK